MEEDQYWTAVVFAVEPKYYGELLAKVSSELEKLKIIDSYHFEIRQAVSYNGKKCVMVAFRICSQDLGAHQGIREAIDGLHEIGCVEGSEVNPDPKGRFNDGWHGCIKAYKEMWGENFEWRIQNLADCSRIALDAARRGLLSPTSPTWKRAEIAHLFLNMLGQPEDYCSVPFPKENQKHISYIVPANRDIVTCELTSRTPWARMDLCEKDVVRIPKVNSAH